MADIKLNEVIYTDINNVLMENANDGDYVKFSTGGDSAVKKVLYTTGQSMHNILDDETKRQQLVTEFPTYNSVYTTNEYFGNILTVNNDVFLFDNGNIRISYWGSSGTRRIQLEELLTLERVIFRAMGALTQLVDVSSNSLQDTGITLQNTGVTKTIAGETFYEAIIVE